MRLLFLTDGLWPFQLGGMQRHSTLLIGELVHRLDRLTVVYCGPPGALPPDIASLEESMPAACRGRIEWLPVPSPSLGRLPGHYISEMRAYARAIAEIVDSEYDACYAQGMTGLEMLGGPIPVMVNLHGLDMFFKPHSAKQWLTQRFLRPIAREMFAADAMVSLGGDLTDILAGAGYERERIVTLANGLDPQEIPSEFPIARTKVRDRGILPRFVLVGRYELSKGFDVLCSALDQVDLSIDLDLIGEWPEIEAHPHRIVHHGVVMSRSKLLGLLDAADVLILSSLTEGMPTVILEAMARGLAVVATDVGAVRELVDEQTGWLVPVADSAALAAAIVAAAWSKPEVIHAMGRAAYHRVQEYTWPRIANQTMDALEDMISRRESP